jgi:hypothetical protein
MITGRSTDPRNPSKILYIDLASAPAKFTAHFRGYLVGLQVLSPTTPVGAYTVTITDSTTGVVLLSAADAAPSGTPYSHEFFPSPVQYLPAPDSQLDQLALISQGDIITVTPSADAEVSNATLMLEFQGA